MGGKSACDPQWGVARGPLKGAPLVDNQSLAIQLAHSACAEFVRLGLTPPAIGSPATGVATLEAHGVRIVVSIASCEPMKLILAPGWDEPLKPPSPPKHNLKEIEKCIVEAAPAKDAAPMPMVKLARLSGYCYNSHFRETVGRLIEKGLLVRIPGGVRSA